MTTGRGKSASDIASQQDAWDELLYQNDRTRVVRKHLPAESGTLIYKEFLGTDAAKRAQHEARILTRLKDVDGVPRLAPVTVPETVLALKDSAGIPLARALGEIPADLPFILESCAALARIVADIHRRGVIHRDINPFNIVLVGAAREPMLIEFDLASTFSGEQVAFVHHRQIAGTLAYLAPEQTGRTGRVVDHRADLYALGATYYKIATSRCPFEQDDPLLLIHDHLTRIPSPPDTLNPQLPKALSALILRLLEKEPDRRYHSADGLAHDLARIREAQTHIGDEAIVLGERDFPLRLAPPSRLIGRETEIGVLETALAGSLHGASRCVLVAGAPGVGKTSLISVLKPMLAARHGWFVSGKFDPQHHHLALDAVWQALRSLGRLLLAESEEQLELLRPQIQSSLGASASLISAMMPELVSLLGRPADQTDADPVNMQARLVQTWVELIRAIASPTRPVVMVLDDLQWSTPASLQFIEAVLMDDRLQGFLLVGAFRESEVNEAHPLAVMRARWEHLGCAPTVLPLNNLPPADLGQLLMEMLLLPRDRADELAEGIRARTGGNPYDTVELVNGLRNDGLLKQTDKGWFWSIDSIRHHGGGEVLELIAARIERLPAATQRLLDEMACLCGDVDLTLLESASGESAASVESLLMPALENRLVMIRREDNHAVQFLNDRVQQAVYARMDETQRNTLRLALARRLMRQPQLQMAAAEQYLPIAGELRDPEECRSVIDLFCTAAARAANVANYMLVERFLAVTIVLLDAVLTAPDNERRLSVQIERHLALYSLGRLDEADEIFADIRRHCVDGLKRSGITCLQVESLANRLRVHDAIALGMDLLSELDIGVTHQNTAQADRIVDELARWVNTGSEADDLQRTEISDLRVIAVARILSSLQTAALLSDRKLLAFLVHKAQRLWEEQGPSAALVQALCNAPQVTIECREDYRTGYRVARRALAFSRARGYEQRVAPALCVFVGLGQHWFEAFEDTVIETRRVRELLLRGGDLQHACFTYLNNFTALFECAPALDAAGAELEAGRAFSARTGNKFALNIQLQFQYLIDSLRGAADLPVGAELESYDRAVLLSLHDDPFAVLTFHVVRAMSAAWLLDMPRMIRHAAEAMPWLKRCTGLPTVVLAHFMQALSLAQRLRESEPEERVSLETALRASRDFVAQRAGDSPDNFGQLLRLLDAEYAWARGKFQEAAAAFDISLHEAAACRRPWHRALITERAGLFHIEHGLQYAGRALLAEAQNLYRDWGAVAKVEQLGQQHDFLRSAVPLRSRNLRRTIAVSADTIDLLAILRISQALSSETHLDRLKVRVTELLGTMTGATVVRLILHDEDSGWHLSTMANEVAQSLSVEEAGARNLLPLSAFRYMQRTLKPLVVDDVMRDDRFSRDPYFSGLVHCSLLAVPILAQGAPRAVLLLENRLSHGAFAADRLDAVMLIAGQLAVSLDNALVYASLEHKVAERTAELETIHKQLLKLSRQAGMAEIAANVLHNVGNVLNSANVSITLVCDSIKRSKLASLEKLVALLSEHQGDLPTFLRSDPRGKHVPAYLPELLKWLRTEQAEHMKELNSLRQNIEHIKEIVSTQQAFAKPLAVKQQVEVTSLMDEALRMGLGAPDGSPLRIVRQFQELPPMNIDRHKILQILINLVSNAKHACMESDRDDMRLTLQTSRTANVLRLSVADNGVGIAAENLVRIFSHGFTTKLTGHGFGLHSSALAAKEMGGSLQVHSDGPGCGATFTVELPVG